MDHVAIETIVNVVKAHGSDAIVVDGCLHLYPKNGGSPRVYPIPSNGLQRRIIIQIGALCGIASHLFWHPSQVALPPVSASSADPAITTQTKLRAAPSPQGTAEAAPDGQGTAAGHRARK